MDPVSLMILGRVGGAAMSIQGANIQAEGMEEHATLIEKYGLEDVRNTRKFGNEKLKHMQASAEAKKKHQYKVGELYESQTKLFEAGVKRDLRDEKKSAADRSRMRHKQYLETSGTHAAWRSAGNIAAYEGHSLNMQNKDYSDFLQDELIDAGDTADRVVDLKFFGGEQAKLMRQQTSLLKDYADMEYRSSLSSKRLTKSALDMEISSMQNATTVESSGIRAGARYTSQKGYAGAFGSLLNLGSDLYSIS